MNQTSDHKVCPVDLYGPCSCGRRVVESEKPGIVWEHASQTYKEHMDEMLRLGGMHECASDCPLPPVRPYRPIAGRAVIPEVTGSFSFLDEVAWTPEMADVIFGPSKQRFVLEMSMNYDWSRWERFKNAVLRFLRVVDFKLPETYVVSIPNMAITNASSNEDRITVDWKLDG